jgi:hypothetical protein
VNATEPDLADGYPNCPECGGGAAMVRTQRVRRVVFDEGLEMERYRYEPGETRLFCGKLHPYTFGGKASPMPPDLL